MKTKYYIRALIPLCVIAAVFRVFEIFFAIESDTGFYVQFSPIPLIFNIFSALSVLFWVVVVVFSVGCGYCSEREKTDSFPFC